MLKSVTPNQEPDSDSFLNLLTEITSRKFIINVTLKINNNFILETTALFDTGADLNCVREGLIPTQYFDKTIEVLRSASGERMKINYKLSNVEIIKNNISYKTSFLLVKDLRQNVILGTPFINLIQPFSVNHERIKSL